MSPRRVSRCNQLPLRTLRTWAVLRLSRCIGMDVCILQRVRVNSLCWLYLHQYVMVRRTWQNKLPVNQVNCLYVFCLTLTNSDGVLRCLRNADKGTALLLSLLSVILRTSHRVWCLSTVLSSFEKKVGFLLVFFFYMMKERTKRS